MGKIRTVYLLPMTLCHCFDFTNLQSCSLLLLLFICPFLRFIRQVTENLLNLLGTMKNWISEIPPIAQPQRFGNKAYRTWFQRVHEVGVFLNNY